MQVSTVHSWKGPGADLYSSSLWIVLHWPVTEVSEVGAKWKQISRKMRCHKYSMLWPLGDHSVEHSDWLAVKFSLSNFAITNGTVCVTPRRPPGYYNQWTPFWGCMGWCCRSARCQWAQRKTAPLWQLHLSAWGREDVATAWITWEKWREEEA